MKLVCISDTHNKHEDMDDLPDGDVLIHSGDMTLLGKSKELKRVSEWLLDQPHKHKIVIPGNHDLSLDPDFKGRGSLPPIEVAEKYFKHFTFLRHESVTLEGVKFFGSPHTPQFFDWAFMYPRHLGAEIWRNVPDDTDVLITHGPPYGILDFSNEHAGCPHLRDRVLEVQPKVHIFGHIHEGYGLDMLGETLCINAAICGINPCVPVNPPAFVEV